MHIRLEYIRAHFKNSHLESSFVKKCFQMQASFHSVVSRCSNSKLSLDGNCDPLGLQLPQVFAELCELRLPLPHKVAF